MSASRVSVWDILDASNEIVAPPATADASQNTRRSNANPEHVASQLWQHSQDLAMLRQAPPSYYIIPGGSQMTLPLMRWTFRGFSIALWTKLPLSQEGKKIRLFKFYSTSKCQGVECLITPLSNDRVTLTMSSITDEKGWRHVSSQFQWAPDSWHFVVLCHRQHYLKKSHVVCFVDGVRVMNEDLSFPAVMGPMVQCLVGGTDINSVMGDSHISSMTMYEDELHADAIATLYRYGPTQTCLRRIPTGVSPFQHSIVTTDTLCPLTTVEKSALSHQNSQLKVVFSVSAHDAYVPNDTTAGPLCVQWTSEGEFDDTGWTRLKMDAADVEFLPQRQILLDDAVTIVTQPNWSEDWFHHGGILSIPVLLDRFLDANAMTQTLLTDALHVMQELLRTSVAHQEDMLHGYGFHVVSHVLRAHESQMRDLLTPSIATTCVELVLNLWPSSETHQSMPLFAAGVHGLLLDFHLWTLAPYKTQSLLIQQILVFVTQHPRSLDVAIQAQHIVDILRTFYGHRVLSDPSSAWIAECVTSLVLVLNRSLATVDEKQVLQIAPDGGSNAPPVRVPFRLVQDLRTICRLLVISTDNALVTRAILNNLCETFEADAAKRVSCVAANVVEVLMLLMGPKHGWDVRLIAMRLFVMLYEWMESDAGRAVFHALERQYQSEAVADPRLWNELAHNSVFNMGLQHSIALNDVTNRAIEMPLSDQTPSPPSSASTPARKETKDCGKPPPSWWKLSSSNRLVLTFSDRLLVVRSIALRQFQIGVSDSATDLQVAVSAAVPSLIALPLRGILPFVSVLFSNAAITPRDRDKVLMEISVVVKTDNGVQMQLLDEPWVVWFGDLLASCATQATGEDLVLDTIITLMCRALYNPHGYLCLDKLFAKFPSLPWRRRVLALIFIRTARNKAMLSRSMAENLYRLLMAATFLLIQDSHEQAEVLMSACLDITELLLESTHNKHRAGVIPGLRLCRLYLAHMPPPLPHRMLQLLATGLQQEVSHRMPIDESIQTQDMLRRVLSSLALARTVNPAVDCSELVLRIATCGLFDKMDELSVERLGAMDAASAVDHVFSILVDEPECLHFDEIVDWTLWMPKWFPVSALSTPSPDHGMKSAVVDAASQVEEKRLWETVKEISKKETDRMACHDVGVDRRRQWTARNWDYQRYKVLTEQIAWDTTGRCCCIYPSTFLSSNHPRHEYQLTRHEMPHPSRRRHRIDVYFKPTMSSPAQPVAVISRDELEKVGRAIAKQGGAVLDQSTAPAEDATEFDSTLQPTSPRSIDDDDDDDADKVSMPAPSHVFAFLHPSSGCGVQPNDRVYLQPLVRKVVPEGLVLGTLSICDHAAVFEPQMASTSKDDVELAAGLQLTYRWTWKDVVAVYLRRFRLRESAIEIFLQNGTAHFLDFHVPDVPSSVAVRDETVRMILAMCPRTTIKQWPRMAPGRIVGNLTKAWQMRVMSNYDYLMALNTVSGRSFNDLTQYPVFPWVLSNYTSDHLDLADPANYRPLNQPMGALNPDRLAEYWERYHSFDDPVIPKFLYGSHYSTAAGSVLYYLMRLQPFSSLHKLTQGGSFDLPDRLFNSIGDVWTMCNSSMSEVKELTPEWFSTPSFLRNVHAFDFGTRQDGVRVGDVELPPWAHNDPEEFIRVHRAALESDFVSAHLHEWIDLIFGYQQRGPDALAANNVFYYLTYSGLVDLDSIDDPHLRHAMEQQIAHFGQCPQQLFRDPHPPRGSSSRSVQEYPPHLTTSLSGHASVVTVKVLSDRVLAVNSLGGIELHHWKLEKDGDKWVFQVERATSPVDVVPRVPVYATCVFPVCMSSQGRVCVSGGAPTGTIHLRLIDLDNGRVLARASADGHTGMVTCIAMDILGEDEFFLSGSTDCSVMLWQLSHMNSPFRPPRVSSCPLVAFRGHKHRIASCALSIPLGIAVSASDTMCLVHNVHTGAVSFGFQSPPCAVFQSVAISSKGYVVACATISDTSVVLVYNLMGSCVRQHSMEVCGSLQISRDGSLVTASLPRSLRCFRLDDFTVAAEYSNPKGHMHAISCSEIGPFEADMLAVTGHVDGSVVWHVLPDADGQLSLLESVGRFLNLNSKLKVVKGTVQQAQKLAMSTIDNAQAVSNTAKDIADEAKSMMHTIFGLFK